MDDALSRYERMSLRCAPLGFTLDFSRIGLADAAAPAPLSERMAVAFERMDALERGALANPDERRRVGHYWLRAPELAPSAEIRAQIEAAVGRALDLAAKIHQGGLAPERGGRFRHAVIAGIGGSALGPELIYDALAAVDPPVALHFLDNTDPDGIDRVLAGIGPDLAATLAVIISKSGGTKETKNGMVELGHAYRDAGLSFGRHALAITREGSELDRHAEASGFIARLPLWDWVGGRTSVMSAVGLFPAAVAGCDARALLAGAAAMDAITRSHEPLGNPAAVLAQSWFAAGNGRGERAMVILPYKDRLRLLSRYLQQLVMESLGKRDDRSGAEVHQGLTVFGNKGATDQHAYVQQLLDGRDDFFVTFVEVLRDRQGASIEVEPGVTSGDYLSAFLQGTRKALSARGRRSLTLTFERLDARALGALIALYERAVGLYAELIDVNAYHQPAVESGKRAATEVLALQRAALAALPASREAAMTARELAAAIGATDVEAVYFTLRHLSANERAQRLEAPEPRGVRFYR